MPSSWVTSHRSGCELHPRAVGRSTEVPGFVSAGPNRSRPDISSQPRRVPLYSVRDRDWDVSSVSLRTGPLTSGGHGARTVLSARLPPRLNQRLPTWFSVSPSADSPAAALLTNTSHAANGLARTPGSPPQPREPPVRSPSTASPVEPIQNTQPLVVRPRADAGIGSPRQAVELGRQEGVKRLVSAFSTASGRLPPALPGKTGTRQGPGRSYRWVTLSTEI